MNKYGLVGWDDPEFSSKTDKKKSKDEFISLNDGSNEVRLLTKPYQYTFHKWKVKGDKGYGRKINCSGKDCPLCEIGDPAKQRWYVGIISRESQSYKILDMSPQVFKQVQKWNRNEKWGDPGTYDINIVVDKDGGPTGYYQVQVNPKEPLTDEEVRLKQSIDPDTLLERCKPPSRPQVEGIMRFILKEKGGNPDVELALLRKEAAEKKAESSSDDEVLTSESEASDSEMTFPPAQVNAN